jgi:hypothetical protein
LRGRFIFPLDKRASGAYVGFKRFEMARAKMSDRVARMAAGPEYVRNPGYPRLLNETKAALALSEAREVLADAGERDEYEGGEYVKTTRGWRFPTSDLQENARLALRESLAAYVEG